MAEKNKAKKKEVKVSSLVTSLEIVAEHLDKAKFEATKFETKERGWKPAGGRIRKELKAISDWCKTLRKHISEMKRQDLE